MKYSIIISHMRWIEWNDMRDWCDLTFGRFDPEIRFSVLWEWKYDYPTGPEYEANCKFMFLKEEHLVLFKLAWC